MFKKLKDKEVYKKYKELKASPQGKARLSLAFWLIFFVFLIIFTRVSINVHVPNNVVNKKNFNRYEYTYSNDVLKVFGYYFDSKQVFIINNDKFYFDGNSVYKVLNHNLDIIPNFDMSFLKIDYNFIIKVTDGINPVKNDSYDRYIIPLTKFIGIYDVDTPIDSSGLDTYNIIIDKYYKDEIINMVKIDLSSYYGYRNINNDGILTIDFYNLDNVSDFTKEYERIIKVVR